jgi:hypothetical protein
MDGSCPIDFMDWHSQINSIWGFGDVEVYRSTQEMYNKALALLIENATLVNNAIWIGDKDALAPEEWGKLTNAPGLQVKLRPGRKLERQSPPPFSSEFVNILGFLVSGMEKLSGITNTLEGRMPNQATSGVAIESLQTAAQVVIRAKARQFEDLLQRIGQRLISRIFQYIEDNRIFNVTGDADIVLAYHAERERIRRFPRTYFDDYRFEVVPGSSLSTSRWQKGIMAAQLHGMQLIDRKAVLDAMEYPERDEIQDRMAVKEEAEMKLAMMQQQMDGKAPRPSGGRKGGMRPDQMSKKFMSDPELKMQQRTVPGAPDVKGFA